MPDAGLPHERLLVLFERESHVHLNCWLPTDTQLTQWVSATLAHSIPRVLETLDEKSDVTVEISVGCVGADQMREMNAQYRKKDRSTNVLSFPADMPLLPNEDKSSGGTLVLGDVILCPDVLGEEATAQDKSIEHHWAHMVIHSVLHLNGLDHESENAAQTMELLEIQILSNLGITNPYLAASATQS